MHERRTGRKKKKHESRKLAETARIPEQSANTRCGGFKKCLPAEYPRADFPEANMRINYEPCSNSRTVRDARGWGENWSPLLQSNQGSVSLSVVRVVLRVSLLCTFRSPPLSSQIPFSSRLLSLPLLFYFISHSRLCLTSVAEFFRSTTIITPRRWKRKTGAENRCKGVVMTTTREWDMVPGKSFGNASIIRPHRYIYMLCRLPTVLHMTIARLVFQQKFEFEEREILMVAKCITASLYNVV